MKIELLILIPDNEAFCSSKKAFIDFLKIDSLISISSNTISFKKTPKSKDQVSAKLRVETNKVKSNNERYFLLILECDQQAHIDEFSDLSDRIKTIAERISPGSTVVNMLWDGVGRTYAEKSYPVINEVENLMRRLIAKFMLITVGMHWSRDAINPELFKKIEKFEEEDPYLNDLHKLDFIHLSQVLFEKKRDITLEELDRILLKTDFNEDDKERILRYTPRSNWEKYFAELVEEKGHSLEKKWELLYKLRNKVAHNRSVKKSEFEQIKGLSTSIKELIEKATSKLGEIDINEEDRELILYSYRSESPSMLGNLAERAVALYYAKNGYDVIPTPENHWDPGFDFLAKKDGRTLSIIVKFIRPQLASLIIHKALQRITKLLSEFPAQDRPNVHLVCVIRESYSDSPEAFFEEIEKKLPPLTSNLELHAGILDADNNYTNLKDRQG